MAKIKIPIISTLASDQGFYIFQLTGLLASKNVERLEINIDTNNDVVTLSGQVHTVAQKDLAQVIAAKQVYVRNVANRLGAKFWSPLYPPFMKSAMRAIHRNSPGNQEYLVSLTSDIETTLNTVT